MSLRSSFDLDLQKIGGDATDQAQLKSRKRELREILSAWVP